MLPFSSNVIVCIFVDEATTQSSAGSERRAYLPIITTQLSKGRIWLVLPQGWRTSSAANAPYIISSASLRDGIFPSANVVHGKSLEGGYGYDDVKAIWPVPIVQALQVTANPGKRKCSSLAAMAVTTQSLGLKFQASNSFVPQTSLVTTEVFSKRDAT